MLSNYSVRKPYTVIVAIILIIILGIVSLTNMVTDLFPSINLPYTVIFTNYNGASPEEIESIVTKPIEQRMASVSNIKSINSVSSEDNSVVILEFTQGTNMDSTLIEIRESLDMIMSYMPEGVRTPTILKINPDMMPVMVLSASLDGQSISESSKYIENKIVPALEGVEGIASIELQGILKNKIHVSISDDKLKEVNTAIAPLKINITKEMISGILKGQNFSMPTGYVTENDVNYLVRTGDELKSIEELKKLPVIVLPGIEPILLEDVAKISEVNNSDEMYTKINGSDAVILTIQKQTEYATSEVSKNIHQKIDEMEKNNGHIKLVSLMDQGEYIDLVVNSINQNLILGAILAVLILLLFLRDIKPTIVIGFAIPISLVTAFVMMYFSGISLNIISMGGLALGIGMLVDNSIVVIENTYRMRNEGKSAKEAAIHGAKQVSAAITSSTLTTISVFLPIVFTKGITRELFTDMGLTIAYSLIASLVIALTLVPMISSKILINNIQKDHKIYEWFRNKYITLLKLSLNHKIIIILITITFLAASIYGGFKTGTSFFPYSDTGQINITLNMPKQNTFKDSVATANEFIDIISKIDSIETTGATMGGNNIFGGGLSGQSNKTVSIYILLKKERTVSTNEVSELIRNKSDSLNCEISISDSNMDMSALTGGAISIQIKGKEFKTLEKISKEISEIISDIEGITEIKDCIEKTEKEISINIDKEKSIQNGITIFEVYSQLASKIKTPSPDTKISIETKDYEIYIKNENDSKMALKDLQNTILTSSTGTQVKLQDISKITETEGYSSIRRNGQQRILTVTASLKNGYNTGKINSKIKNLLDKYDTPDGYSVEQGGEYESMMDAFYDLFLMLILAVIFIYLIMVAQFQSLLSPFIVMFTIPLAFTGGLIGLIVTQNPISVISVIGFIILSGVVVNNGIVFIDYTNIIRKEGMRKRDALIKAGHDRLRPIIMTALTTILGLSTLSFGMGQGTELIQPMAITAIGGLIYSTLLTLFLIPILYDLFNKETFKNLGIAKK